uniref:Uncharacterized protein n=1 Tax=Arundo donax TaxID=35708 RepID=A0A0A9HDN9_ARUDO
MCIRWECKETIHATYLKLKEHRVVSGSHDDSAAHEALLRLTVCSTVLAPAVSSLARTPCTSSELPISCIRCRPPTR